MLSPVQIKQESIGAGKVTQNIRSNISDNTNYLLAASQDVGYNQDIQMKNGIEPHQGMIQTGDPQSVSSMKDYLQHGMLFQLNQTPDSVVFSPIQIKHEIVGAEDVNHSIKTSIPDNSKYPIFVNQDVEYKFRQLPILWDHSQLPYDLPVKNRNQIHQGMFHTEDAGSLSPGKTYVPHSMLFQFNQCQGGPVSAAPSNEECRSNIIQDNQDIDASHEMQHQKPVDQTLNTIQSQNFVRHNRPGRPPKGSAEANITRKSKCQCEICFKEFGHKSNLFIHMRTHNGERPYKCNQCEKSFTHSGNLAIHMRTHSGERPYGCQICGKMFSHSGNLSTHLRTHSGVKPYKCGVCGKEFRHSGNLSIHERIHSGIKPFQCKICGKDFYHSGNLTTHMKKHAINLNINVNQCGNERRQVLSTVGGVKDISINPLNNLPLTPMTSGVKALHNTNNIPVKNECSNETASPGTAALTRTGS